jgi:HD-GYP domain-containing protein (c-di-GMP phosphodiesterase class II)
MRVAVFRDIAGVAANHHERLDGTGYYRGVTGESLDLPSRILAVADVYDALSQDRPYRQAMPGERVIGILKKDSGGKLCPLSVAALEELVSRGDL